VTARSGFDVISASCDDDETADGMAGAYMLAGRHNEKFKFARRSSDGETTAIVFCNDDNVWVMNDKDDAATWLYRAKDSHPKSRDEVPWIGGGEPCLWRYDGYDGGRVPSWKRNTRGRRPRAPPGLQLFGAFLNLVFVPLVPPYSMCACVWERIYS